MRPLPVPPAGARTYSRNPPKGRALAAVHGQVLGDVAHVLVTGPEREVILQWSGRFFDAHDRAMLTLTTLVVAAGLADEGAEAIAASLSDAVLEFTGFHGRLPYAAPGGARSSRDHGSASRKG